MNRPTLPWSAAMHELRKRQLFGAMVREERLRATLGLPGEADLTSWRGRSGRRYVVGTQRLWENDERGERDARTVGHVAVG